MRTLLCVAVVGFLVYGVWCHDDAQKNVALRNTHVEITPAVSPSVVSFAAAREQKGYVDAAKEAMAKGPIAVVALLAQWDTAGKTLSSGMEPAYDSARSLLVCWVPESHCTSDEPGWDTYSVVRGYQITPLVAGGDTARVDVEYQVDGESAEQGWNVQPGVAHWVVRLRRMPEGWRVVGTESQKAPSISRETTVRRGFVMQK